MKWPLRIGIDVSGLTILDPEQINLERINGFDGVLPTLLAERYRVRFFSPQLGEIDMHVWMRQQEIRNDTAGKQLAPLDAEFSLRQNGHRRCRMSVLTDNQAAKSQRPAEQLNVRPAKLGLIANEPLIHGPFEPCSEYRIEEVRRDKCGDDQN